MPRVSIRPFLYQPYMPDPVRVIASHAAMADAGITWLFETIARCIGSGSTQLRIGESPAASQMNLFGRCGSGVFIAERNVG